MPISRNSSNVYTTMTVTDANLMIQNYITSEGEIHKKELWDKISSLAYLCHGLAVAKGWWHDKERNVKGLNIGERLALIHSEVSEALEGVRKNLPSDHINTDMFTEELADVIIRTLDLAYAYHGTGIVIQEAIFAKLEYNQKRKDHTSEAREAEGGKKF